MEAIEQDEDRGPAGRAPPRLAVRRRLRSRPRRAPRSFPGRERACTPAGPGRRALLIERDGISVDTNLREALQRQQASVETMPGEGYGKMMVEPQLARAPAATVERVAGWIAALEPSAGPFEPGLGEEVEPTGDTELTGDIGPSGDPRLGETQGPAETQGSGEI